MTPQERAFSLRLRNRAARLQPDLQRRLLAAWDLIRGSLSEAELARAIRSGSVQQLLNDFLSDETLDQAFGAYRELIQRQSVTAAETWTRNIPEFMRPALFDALNPRVFQALRNLDSRVMQEMRTEVRETVRQAALGGFERGENPRATARRIRETVGLSPRQETAVLNFRRQLEAGDRSALTRVLGRGEIRRPDGSSIVREAHAGGQGLSATDIAYLERQLGKGPIPADWIDRRVDQYRRRLNSLNAEAHSRTVALDAQRLAQRNAWESAIDQGTVDRTRLRRVWLAVAGPGGDGRNRPEHLALHGTEVLFDQPYPNGQMIPGETDYNCRCGERIVLVAASMRLAA